MRMHVANGSKQNHNFVYVVKDGLGVARQRTQHIPIGQQIVLSEDLSQEQVDAIVQHHAPYGFIAASEVDHSGGVIPLCFAVGKEPISERVIEHLFRRNTGFQVIAGKQLRKEAALAGNDALERSLQESGRQERLTEMEATFVEENHDPRSSDPELSESLLVTRAANQNPPNPSSRAARRARRKAA